MGILRSRNRSEIDFLEKKSENVANTGNPLPWLATCVIWSQHAQNIFLESLEVFLKNFQNFFHTTLFENFLPNNVSVAAAKNQPAQGLGTPQNRSMTQKIDFFKVRDIDTPIQPRKKKHQTNVSSALKTF